jgi:hypothetical protein
MTILTFITFVNFASTRLWIFYNIYMAWSRVSCHSFIIPVIVSLFLGLILVILCFLFILFDYEIFLQLRSFFLSRHGKDPP